MQRGKVRAFLFHLLARESDCSQTALHSPMHLAVPEGGRGSVLLAASVRNGACLLLCQVAMQRSVQENCRVLLGCYFSPSVFPIPSVVSDRKCLYFYASLYLFHSLGLSFWKRFKIMKKIGAILITLELECWS